MPAQAQTIYLDHNATAPLEPAALDEMMPFLTQHHGNSLSGHSFGRPVFEAIERARKQTASLIGSSTEELIFTSGGSESLNHALKGLAFARPDGPKRILYGATEHHAVEDAAKWLERFGFQAVPLPVDRQGVVQPEVVAQALEAGPALLVAVMWANNEVGTLQPVQAIGALCRAAGVPFLCDAVQAAGKVPVNVEHVDLLALAGHKLYGPKGIGALYIRSGLQLEPLIHGASHEQGRRAGTSPTAQMVGMGAAAAAAAESLREEGIRLTALRDRLEARLLADVPGAQVHGREASRLPNTSCASFAGVTAWELQAALDRKGVAVSAGAACRSGVPKPSPVLLAMGVAQEAALGGVRFSLGRYTTAADVETAAGRVADTVRKLREHR